MSLVFLQKELTKIDFNCKLSVTEYPYIYVYIKKN